MMDRKALSDLRQKIVDLRKEREKLENSLFRPKKMIRASLVFLPNYCGKKHCRSKKGFPQGPYPYLSGSALVVYGRDKYYGIFSAVNYANLVAERTAKVTAKSTTREFVRELEKILAEGGQKKKITDLMKKLKQE